ncbi:hypothetical protein [uncultured Microbulbifer sp.]|uniref:hypothetical protein n=1 Tax=uncultured Microbulbifer sp. TaxID=348147 RepID=UPI0026095F0E|nr:hypothetical protein [uncultured Microbulbifer sp.]
MCVVSIPEAITRLSTTNPGSPLAVFRTQSAHLVKAVFANTVVTQFWINQGHINYLESFHRDNLPVAERRFQDYFESMPRAT